MKKINDLKQERAAKIAEMGNITKLMETEKRNLNTDETSKWNALDAEITVIDEQVRMLEKQEELNKRSVSNDFVKSDTLTSSMTVQFRDWLLGAKDGKGAPSFELRADPFISTTDTGIINKQTAGGIDILNSPAEDFLKSLGVTFYPGLVGNFIVPSMGEDTATFASESGDASTADMSSASLTLAARRVTHTQSISTETLAQTNPTIYTSILQNLVNGIWNAVTNDVFDQIDTDAATQKTSFGGTTLDYAKIVQMEASIGGLNIGKGAYVTTPTVKAYLKKTAGLTNQDAIWTGNEVNGYPAFGVPSANSGEIYFGDFSRAAIGQWDGLKIIVDPYTKAKQGQIVLTVIGMFDAGVTNKRAFCILTNASVG